MKEIKNVQFLSLKTTDKIFGLEKSLLKLFLKPLIIVILFLVSLGLVIIPKVDDIKNNIKNINDNNSLIKLTNEKKNYLVSIDIEQLNRNAEMLNRAVLKEKKSFLLVGVIRKIADNFGFQVKSFLVSPGEVKESSQQTLKVSSKETAIKMPINVILVGPNNRNLELIKALENSLPILFIDKFESKTSDDVSELEMTISSYYVPSKSDYTSGNLTLKDLQLTKDESELLLTIGKYEMIDEGVSNQAKNFEYVEYSRSNPFSL